MSARNVYLAKYRRTTSQRAHFAIFIPNIAYDRGDVSESYHRLSTKGTVIHVVGEPIVAGFTLEFRRNYECIHSIDLKQLILLGTVDSNNVYEPNASDFTKETIPRSNLEREAARVPPPRGGQNVRAPIDGVQAKRCQEWTMEYLDQLVRSNLIDRSAIDIAQTERDPPNMGIFGAKAA